MAQIVSLWGDEINIPSTKEVTKKIINKINNEKTTSQLLKSKLTPIEKKIDIIKENVYKVLGHYKDIITVIKTREELNDYISKAIEGGIISIDTETNNSVDTMTCLLMGACIYSPGLKSAYVPVNHTDLNYNRLKNQVTEKDIKEEFERLSNTKIIFHNAKFDYKVLKNTCNVDLNPYWDTLVGARLINENESAKLKDQYRTKIDPEQEKYSINELFEGMEYCIFDPDLFAYYAATDAYITYELYKYQVEKFKEPGLEGSKWIFDNIEMPLIKVVAKMELTGIDIDQDYAKRLSAKYHKLSDDINKKLDEEVYKYKEVILKWRLTPEANYKAPNKKGDGFNKSKAEQLEDPIKLSSPTQLAILLYDILKLPQVSKKAPRGTGVDELKSLAEKTKLPLCKMMLEYRGLDKLLNTFIDKLPNDISSVDGRVHCEFNSLGTDTGRFSSSSPNLQQLPRSDISIKPMFRATPSYEKEIEFEDSIILNMYEEIETDNGWVKVKDLKVGDKIKDNNLTIKEINKLEGSSIKLDFGGLNA